MMEYGKPIRIFYANLLRIGVTLRVVAGVLRIAGDGREFLSPVYRDEIKRRAPQLIELLSPAVPEPLQPYWGRLITVAELNTAIEIAKRMNVKIRETPANGGWIFEVVEQEPTP